MFCVPAGASEVAFPVSPREGREEKKKKRIKNKNKSKQSHNRLQHLGKVVRPPFVRFSAYHVRLRRESFFFVLFIVWYSRRKPGFTIHGIIYQNKHRAQSTGPRVPPLWSCRDGHPRNVAGCVFSVTDPAHLRFLTRTASEKHTMRTAR